MGNYKFGNNTYPRRIRRRSNLGHIFQGKSVSYGPGNMVIQAAAPTAACYTTSPFVQYTVYRLNLG